MIDAIAKRRSVRKYVDRPVTDDELKDILLSAFYAPSSMNRKPVHYVVVKEQATKEKLATATPHVPFAASAPLVLVICGDASLSPKWMEDCCIAAAHVMLACADLGLGACWGQVRLNSNEGRDADEYVRQLLNIPDNFRVECLMAIGQPLEGKPAHTEAEWDDGRVHREKF